MTPGHNLPRFWAGLLHWAAARLDLPDTAADAREIFEQKVEREGLSGARRWYRRQALIALRHALTPGSLATPRASFARDSAGLMAGRSPGTAPGTVGLGGLLDGLTRELRLGARRVMRRPSAAASFAAVVGIGIAAAAFMAQVRDSMFAPPGGTDRSLSMVVWVDDEGQASPFLSLTGSEPWLDEAVGSIQTLAPVWAARGTFRTPAGLIRAAGARVLPGHLERMGVSPIRGRDLEAAGEVVLSAALWESRWEGRNDLIGSTVEVDGVPRTIVGVAPSDFTGAVCCIPPQFWTVTNDETPQIARLFAVDAADLSTAASRLTEIAATVSEGRRADLDHPAGRPFGGEAGFVSSILRVLMGLALAVWIMTLLSGANLILSDTLSRKREFELRTAIGARGRHTLVRALVEAGWLALLAAGFAILATALMSGVAPWLLPMLGRSTSVSVTVGRTAFAVAAVGAALSALACALPSIIAAIRMSRSANVGRGRATELFAGAGLSVQVSLACAMFLVTALFVQSIREYDGDFTGFRNGATAVHFVSTSNPVDPDRALEAIGASVPGVRAALTSRLPVYGAAFDSIALPDGSKHRAAVEVVTPGFFDVVGTQLLAGAPATTSGETVISADLAVQMGGMQAALGQQVAVSDTVLLRVTGVVEAATWGTGEVRRTLYRSWDRRPVTNAVLLVDSRNAQSEALGPLLGALGPLGLALEPFETLDGMLVRSRVIEVFLMRLATGFGLLALLVAVGAIHAHFVRWVRAKERDMAIRAALGAPFRSLGVRLVARALMSVLPGLVLGAWLGWGAAQLIAQSLGPIPEVTVAIGMVVTAVVLGASAFALTGPLVRTRHVEPLRLMKES